MEGGKYPILERFKNFDQLNFALRFVDEAKRRVGQPMCFDKLAQGRPASVAGLGPAGNPIQMAENLVITDNVFDRHVSALDLNLLKESVDVARAKSLLAVATLVGRNKGRRSITEGAVTLTSIRALRHYGPCQRNG